ncbi:MAG TPA: diadenylate cyclase [Myxococcota bacterium]|nr:diadenylate cyclase [Myxococcota bacterium]
MANLFSIFFWLDLVDIATVGVLLWLAIRFVRRTRGRRALIGLTLLGGVYLLARALDLQLTASLFQGFFAVLVLVIVVVFQEDLRRLFEQLGSLRGSGSRRDRRGVDVTDVIVRAVARLAATRVGALIVLPQREPIESHVEGGIPLEGRISEPLLLSIFDASSPGHDGAVILRGSQLERFAVHLPLSVNRAALGAGGTRHAAALGLSERCDATCIVVSEERGTVSVARDGAIRVLARPQDLALDLLAARGASEAAEEWAPWWRDRAGVDAVLAAAGALALWLVFVPGSAPTEVTVPAAVKVTNLPDDLEIESVEPTEVQVTLRGLRRDLVLSDPDQVSVRVDGFLARMGRRTFAISEDSVRRPEALDVVAVHPERVKVSLRPVEAGSGAGS